MSNSSKISNGGLSITTILGIVFIILKLCKVIDWSWWLVTLPLWGGAVLVVAVIIVFLIAAWVIKD